MTKFRSTFVKARQEIGLKQEEKRLFWNCYDQSSLYNAGKAESQGDIGAVQNVMLPAMACLEDHNLLSRRLLHILHPGSQFGLVQEVFVSEGGFDA